MDVPQIDPQVDIEVAEASEVLLGFRAATSDAENFESGRQWFDSLRTTLSPQLTELASRFDATPGGGSPLAHQVIGRLADGPLDLAGFLDRLGDDLPVVRDTLAAWHREVFAPHWPELRPILERDADAKRRLLGSGPLADLIEEATNGGEYVPEAGVDRLLLLPTYLGRPWISTARQGRTLVMCYPVSDDALAPTRQEAQRLRILRLSKALGDETRLRALRRLAEGEFTLQELADHLGIQKSTMHHHLGPLRAAGLVRLRLGEKRYSLRPRPLAEASELLGDYLGSGNSATRRSRTRG